MGEVLVTVKDIAEMLGVSSQRVQELVARKSFPAPYDKLRTGRVWKRQAVAEWISNWDRRTGRPSR